MFGNVKTAGSLVLGLLGFGCLGVERDQRKAERGTRDKNLIMGSPEGHVKDVRF